MYIRWRSDRGSWHVIRTWTRVPNVAAALCGKRPSGPTADTFGDEKSCESCLRINAKRAPDG